MGNRANVIFTATQGGDTQLSPCVYLHGNGGPESVYAFLAELDSREVRADAMYDAARFVQIAGEFFDQPYHSGLSLGIVNGPDAINPNHGHAQAAEVLGKIATDAGDNGFYVVNRDGGKLTVRRFTEQGAQTVALKEWPARRVAAERKKALANAQYADIRAHFDKVRKPTEREYFDTKYAKA